jgi:hypothetical protein
VSNCTLGLQIKIERSPLDGGEDVQANEKGESKRQRDCIDVKRETTAWNGGL